MAHGSPESPPHATARVRASLPLASLAVAVWLAASTALLLVQLVRP